MSYADYAWYCPTTKRPKNWTVVKAIQPICSTCEVIVTVFIYGQRVQLLTVVYLNSVANLKYCICYIKKPVFRLIVNQKPNFKTLKRVIKNMAKKKTATNLSSSDKKIVHYHLRGYINIKRTRYISCYSLIPVISSR